MSTVDEHYSGDTFIQSPIISSTSDFHHHYHYPFPSRFHIRGRTTYSSRLRFEHLRNEALHHYNRLIERNNATVRSNINESSSTSSSYDFSTRFAILAVICIFLTAISSLYVVYLTFPNITQDEKAHIKIPWNIDDAKELGTILDRYKIEHYYHVMAGIFLVYIFLQSFAIPGSLFLSILSGYLFPFHLAIILVCTCSMLGATLCYCLSQLLGRRLILKYLPEKASKWKKDIEKHKNNLFNYIVFLRITPFLPNWFINLSAPIVGVPLLPFALGTFVGVAPPSFFAIKGGQTLHDVTVDSINGFSWNSVMWLTVFGLISITPVFLRNRI